MGKKKKHRKKPWEDHRPLVYSLGDKIDNWLNNLKQKENHEHIDKVSQINTA